MKKTGEEIEKHVYQLVRLSPVASEITGKVYRKGMRPFDSRKEDIVIGFLTATSGQIQTGVVNINAWVPDIDAGGSVLVKDIARCEQLGGMIRDFIEGLTPTNYKYSLDSTISTFEEKEIDQHYINVRLKFDYITI